MRYRYVRRVTAGLVAAAAVTLSSAGCAPASPQGAPPTPSASAEPSEPATTAPPIAAPRAIGAPPPGDAAAPVSATGRVVKVTDGDTIHVAVDGGPANLDVRVVGLDTPETKKPGTPVQCWGLQATAAAHGLLDGQRVTLRRDPTQADLDRYGRSLRYVTLPTGEDYSQHAVNAGDGRAYKLSRGPVPQEWLTLVADQSAAQAAHHGLWGPPCLGGV